VKDLLKAILKTGSGSIVTLLFAMVAVKLIASRQGAEALGTFSLIKQVIVAGSTMFITGGQTALVQGMSSRAGEDRREFQATACALLCGGSFAVGLAMVLAGFWTGIRILPLQQDTRSVLWIAGIAVATSGPMAFVFGSLNANRRIGTLAIAQASNAFTLAMLAWIAVSILKLGSPRWFAAMIAGSQLPGIALGLVFLHRRDPLRLSFSIRRKTVLAVANIAVATVIGALLQGWTVLYVRGAIAKSRGLAAAGVFDAGWTISMVYVMLILGAFATYYLPTLAAQGINAGHLIEDVLRTSLLLSVPLIALVTVLRPMIIVILYSPEFLPATKLMHWMLIGDFFKVLGFVLAMPMLALADMRAFLFGEAGWNLAMVIGTHVVIRNGWPTEWVGAVFAISYLAYLIYAWSYCRRRMRIRLERSLLAPLVTGFLTILVAALATWSYTRVSGNAIAMVVVGCLIHVLTTLHRIETEEPRITNLETV
jgi:O-antigen/teichoic acid export membrane protein